MQITLKLSDGIHPFERMLDVIREKKSRSAVKVTFERDDLNGLFYEIEGNLVDEEKVIDVIFGK